MALESLSNGLERALALNGQRQGSSATQVRSDPTTNSAEWSVDQQYLVGDWVVDPDDGQMYVFNGVHVVSAGPPAVDEISTSVLGGLSPYNGGAGWLKTAPNGVTEYASLLPTFTIAGAGAWTAPTNNVISVPAVWSSLSGTEWLVTIQGLLTFAAPQVATDWQRLTLTATGTGAVSASCDVAPVVGELTTAFSATLAVQTGTGVAPFTAQTITLSGTAGAASTLSECRLTAVRLF